MLQKMLFNLGEGFERFNSWYNQEDNKLVLLR